MARLSLPSDDQLTPKQRDVCAEVVSGKRGKIPSPMVAWLQNPELARRAQSLGELLRFQTTLEPHLVELAVLVCARHWTSHQVWTSHKRLGLAAGIAAEVVDAIASRRQPTLASEREGVVFDVSATLLGQHRLTDDQYGRAVAALGEPGVVELVAIVGYYGLVALTANAFELGLPQNLATELEDTRI
ncbi:MAG: carboxymuconolactone decarboxylase family protein [Devosia sp.]